METVAVVLYRPLLGGLWKQQPDGVFEGEDAVRMAENYVEILNSRSQSFVHAYIVGPIINPLPPKVATAQLGEF